MRAHNARFFTARARATFIFDATSHQPSVGVKRLLRSSCVFNVSSLVPLVFSFRVSVESTREVGSFFFGPLLCVCVFVGGGKSMRGFVYESLLL